MVAGQYRAVRGMDCRWLPALSTSPLNSAALANGPFNYFAVSRSRRDRAYPNDVMACAPQRTRRCTRKVLVREKPHVTPRGRPFRNAASRGRSLGKPLYLPAREQDNSPVFRPRSNRRPSVRSRLHGQPSAANDRLSCQDGRVKCDMILRRSHAPHCLVRSPSPCSKPPAHPIRRGPRASARNCRSRRCLRRRSIRSALQLQLITGALNVVCRTTEIPDYRNMPCA
jgi:hypothetical protein